MHTNPVNLSDKTCMCVCLFVVGFLVDKTGNYGSAFYSCAAGMILGALFLGLVRPVKLGLCRRRQKGQSTDSSPSKSSTDVPVDFLDVDLAGGQEGGSA